MPHCNTVQAVQTVSGVFETKHLLVKNKVPIKSRLSVPHAEQWAGIIGEQNEKEDIMFAPPVAIRLEMIVVVFHHVYMTDMDGGEERTLQRRISR